MYILTWKQKIYVLISLINNRKQAIYKGGGRVFKICNKSHFRTENRNLYAKLVSIAFIMRSRRPPNRRTWLNRLN